MVDVLWLFPLALLASSDDPNQLSGSHQTGVGAIFRFAHQWFFEGGGSLSWISWIPTHIKPMYYFGIGPFFNICLNVGEILVTSFEVLVTSIDLVYYAGGGQISLF